MKSKHKPTRVLRDGRLILSDYDWKLTRQRFYDKQGGCCATCGQFTLFEYFHLHHKRVRGLGGSKRDDRDDNLIGLCEGCHNAHHARQDGWRSAKI